MERVPGTPAQVESRAQVGPRGHQAAAGGAARGYLMVTKASRSTRGRPAVPTTTSLTVWEPEAVQVLAQASRW